MGKAATRGMNCNTRKNLSLLRVLRRFPRVAAFPDRQPYTRATGRRRAAAFYTQSS
jgi:hypothetical protein